MSCPGLACVGHPRWRWRQTALLPVFWLGSGRQRNRAAQSAVDRWANGVDSPCAAQTRPSPTKPERPPSSGHTDASAESWCAALHQGVACAQGQDVVVAHQPGGGDYLRINSLRRVERKCRLRWSGGNEHAVSTRPARRGQQSHFKYRVDRFLTAVATPAPELYSQFRQQMDVRCDGDADRG